MDTPPVIERLVEAMNGHDLEAFLDCFDPDYDSEQPLHPELSFRGRDRVRENWSVKLSEGSDFRAELVQAVAVGDRVWTEWRWLGTRADGTSRDERGVIIYQIEGDRIVSGRLYIEQADVPPA